MSHHYDPLTQFHPPFRLLGNLTIIDKSDTRIVEGSRGTKLTVMKDLLELLNAGAEEFARKNADYTASELRKSRMLVQSTHPARVPDEIGYAADHGEPVPDGDAHHRAKVAKMGGTVTPGSGFVLTINIDEEMEEFGIVSGGGYLKPHSRVKRIADLTIEDVWSIDVRRVASKIVVCKGGEMRVLKDDKAEPELPEDDLARIERIEGQMLQSGDVDSDDMEWMAKITRAFLTTAIPACSPEEPAHD